MKNNLGKCVRSLFCAAISVGFSAVSLHSQGQIVTLSDANTVAQISVGNQAGMYYWNVDGQNQLFQQWFWYRVGNVGGEHSIDTIGAPSITTPTASTLNTTYANSQLSVLVKYSLTGGSLGSGISDISEQISLHNNGSTPLDLHFFQYSDFDLGGVTGGDTVSLDKDTRGYYGADQTKGPYTLSETVVSPRATHGEAAFYNQTLLGLNDASPTTLNDNAGPVGPGDVTWGFEWDLSLGVGGTFVISKDKYLSVPEPSAFALISVGLVVFAAIRRRGLAGF